VTNRLSKSPIQPAYSAKPPVTIGVRDSTLGLSQAAVKPPAPSALSQEICEASPQIQPKQPKYVSQFQHFYIVSSLLYCK